VKLPAARTFVVAGALAIAASGCSASPSAEGSRTQAVGLDPPPVNATVAPPDSVPTEQRQPEPTPGSEPGSTGRGSRTLPGTSVEDAESTVAENTVAEDDISAGQEPAATRLDALPISPLLGDLVRSWDRLNLDLVLADPEGVERVAAEVEQFTTVRDNDGRGVFGASLTTTGVLGGSVNQAGEVVEMMTIAVMSDERDAGVAITSLRYAADGLGETSEMNTLLRSVANQAAGYRETLAGPDTVVVIERFGLRPEQVLIALVRGAGASDIEARIPSLAAEVMSVVG
jgi:hypothetical protein